MKYHCVKQHDITDCGAACLATISIFLFLTAVYLLKI